MKLPASSALTKMTVIRMPRAADSRHLRPESGEVRRELYARARQLLSRRGGRPWPGRLLDRPFSSIPDCSKVKMSCVVMTWPSMLRTSVIDMSRRVPSGSRSRWTMRSRARAMTSRTRWSLVLAMPMPTMVSTRDSASCRVGVDRRHGALVTGVHRLEHVHGLSTADLADDDAVGAHSGALRRDPRR